MKKLAFVTLLASSTLAACASDGYHYDDRRYYSRDYEPVYLERDVYYASKEGMGDYYFDSMDFDGSEHITFSEHQAYAEIAFDKADTNNDGILSRQEVRDYVRYMAAGWKPVKRAYYHDGRSKKGSPNVRLPNRTNTNPTEHSANPTNPSQEHR